MIDHDPRTVRISLERKAGRLIRSHWGTGTEIGAPVLIREGSRCGVYRCALTGGGAPSSLILKAIKDGPNASQCYSDWAALRFLNTCHGLRGVVPEFYGGDIEERLYFIEDLGGSRSLEHALLEEDCPAVVEMFRELARRTALLHRETRGKEEAYHSLRSELPHPEGNDRIREAERWSQSMEKVYRWFEAVDCPLPDQFGACCERIAQRYAQPGEFLTFTHGDMAPSNNHVSGCNVRLLDFEYGGYRHALYDLTAWEVLCPMPHDLVEEMKRVYRGEWDKGSESGVSEMVFQHGWAVMCAYRALAMLTWTSIEILAENKPWVGEWTARHAVLTALTRLAEVSRDQAELEPVMNAADRLRHRLIDLWPEITVFCTHWPAFDR